MRNARLTTPTMLTRIAGLILIIAASASGATAETPAWFTCPDRSEFDPRDRPAASALIPAVIKPSAGAATSDDLAAHARLAAMAYAMFDADVAGQNPTVQLTPGLKLVGLIYGDPGRRRIIRLRKSKTRSLFGVIADDPTSGRRLIVLRGTLKPIEWLRNMQARLKPFPLRTLPIRAPANVHAGFRQIFASLELVAKGRRQNFVRALAELTSGRKVTFIGHSLGGALATLSGVEAARVQPEDAVAMRIVTFASPRVGDPGFAKLAKAVGRIDRVCNVVDIVPAVPPSRPRTPYVHVGRLFRISSFDWPDLKIGIGKPGQQVTCRHSILAYAYMLAPVKAKDEATACLQGD